jgi:hypothetical protein
MTSTTTPTPAAHQLGRPVRASDREAQYLHVEHVGEGEWTPWLAGLGLVLFFAPVIAVMTALTFAAYYVAQ